MAIEKDLTELIAECDVAKIIESKKIPMATETANLLLELGFKTSAASVAAKLHPILKAAEIAAGKYIEITPEKIQAFLNRRAEDYNKSRPKKKSDPCGDIVFSTAQSLGGMYNSLYNQIQNQILNLQSSNAISYQTGTSSALWGGALPGTMTDWAGLGAVSNVPIGDFHAVTLDANSSAEGTIGRFVWTEVGVGSYIGIPPTNVLLKLKKEKAKNVFDYYSVASVNAVKDPLLLGRINGSQSRYFIAQWGDDVKLDDVI
jgi:hypothetical protein